MKSAPDPSCLQTAGTTEPVPPPGIRDSPVIVMPQQVPGSRPAAPRKNPGRLALKREPALYRDSFFGIRHDDAIHIISENYAYKTESYYTILSHELEGREVRPSSSAVLDAYVVPLCLERAAMADIPVCEWGISQGYAPLPAILYGLNYFATTAEYHIVSDDAQSKEAIGHLTNRGKYPFCYQKLPEGATISTCISVFGKTAGKCRSVEHLAEQVYDLFSIPLVTMVTVSLGSCHLLSSLSPTRYSRLSQDERSILHAYLRHQEFL